MGHRTHVARLQSDGGKWRIEPLRADKMLLFATPEAAKKSLAFMQAFGQIWTRNNVNNNKNSQHLTTLGVPLNTQLTLRSKSNVEVLYMGEFNL